MNEDNILPKDMNDTDVFRPQQGLTISILIVKWKKENGEFSSPTGVNYYEWYIKTDSR